MIQIDSSELVEKAINDEAALIFKHSTSCPISFRASRQIQSFEAEFPEQRLYIVDVIRHRRHSLEIAQRLNLRHESPQVILVDDSKVVWDASHSGVTSDAIKNAIKKNEKEH